MQLTQPQLNILSSVLAQLFGPKGDQGTYLSDVMQSLAAHGVQASREAVIGAIEVAASPGYDKRQPEERWGSWCLVWNATDESLCAC